MKRLLKNFSAAFVANGVHLMVTVFVTLYIPRFCGIEEYANWQLYIFYTSYLWILAFGWPDGLYLRCGGKQYGTLDMKGIKSQFLIVFCYMLVSFPVLMCFFRFFPNSIVFLFVLIDSLIEIPREAFMKILQATSRNIDYAKILVSSRLLFLVLVMTKTFTSEVDFTYMVFSDLISKAIGLIISAYYCKEIILSTISLSKKERIRVWNEFRVTISSGSKVMFGMICSMLIIGVVRLAIQNHWGLVAFGKVSLTLSVSNLFNVFITAVSLVLFPELKNQNRSMLIRSYRFIENALIMTMFLTLVFYYPIKLLMDLWLPQYKDGLQYMALLFPICVYQSKTTLLAYTYQKALGQEKWIFFVNMTVLLLSVITTGVTVYLFDKLDLAVFSIVVLLVIRNVFLEITVWRALGINHVNTVILEIILTVVFIAASWYVGGITGLAIYAMAYALYLLIKRKDVAFIVNSACNLLRQM